MQSIDESFACINEASLPVVKQRKALYSLGDFITSLPQDRETTEKIGDYLRTAKQFGFDRTAIHGAPVLMRMRYKRVAPDVNVEFFDDR